MLKQHLVDWVLKLTHLDDLDADILTSFIISPLVYCAAIAFPNMLIYLVWVALNALYHLRIFSYLSRLEVINSFNGILFRFTKF